MNTKPIKVVLLRNNDRIIDAGRVMKVTDFQLVLLEDIATYTLSDEDGYATRRWAALGAIVDKVVS